MRPDQMDYLGVLTPEQLEIAELAPADTPFEVIERKADNLALARFQYRMILAREKRLGDPTSTNTGALTGDAPHADPGKEIK